MPDRPLLCHSSRCNRLVRVSAIKNVHRLLRDWYESRIIERICRHVAADRDNAYMMTDSMIICAHQHSAGGLKKGRGIRPLGDPVAG